MILAETKTFDADGKSGETNKLFSDRVTGTNFNGNMKKIKEYFITAEKILTETSPLKF
jgi:hypothetical protein